MISTVEIDSRKLQHLQTLSEGHFVDFKSKRIAPNKLTRTISAMANADGGEIYVGIEDPSNGWVWDGFFQPEDANGHISAFENIFLLGYGLNYTFIFSDQENGFVLHVEVAKSEKIVKSSDGEIYLRRSASNIPVKTEEQKHRLELDKGIYSFEDDRIKIDKEDIDNSLVTNKFMVTQIPTSEPESWFRKQKILFDNNMASVAGVMLFTDEPQVYLPKTAVKIYRYLTSDDEGSRENLETDPISVDGDVYEIIQKSVKFVREKIESISIVGSLGLEKVEYPTIALHEIITNAVLHRDYSVKDDVHIRIFDNRIEVESPGVLPGHVTEKNILKERSVRNPKMFRLINKFPSPPNKDVGEGLNATFDAMRRLRLKEPEIRQRSFSVLVVLKHEKLGSSEELVVDFLRKNPEINNATARQICNIGDANQMKRVFQKMMKAGIIERIPGRPQVKSGYVKGFKFPS